MKTHCFDCRKPLDAESLFALCNVCQSDYLARAATMPEEHGARGEPRPHRGRGRPAAECPPRPCACCRRPMERRRRECGRLESVAEYGKRRCCSRACAKQLGWKRREIFLGRKA